jgi:hypothetical protein
MEFLTNWKLMYRDDQELLSFAKGINKILVKDIIVEKEPTCINSFLVIEKK